MRRRPMRANIYQPVVRLGVNDADWPFVIIGTIAVFAIAFLTEAEVWGLPVSIPAAVLSFAALVAFFNWARRGRPPRWLHHCTAALFRPERLRRRLPEDSGDFLSRPWIRGPYSQE